MEISGLIAELERMKGVVGDVEVFNNGMSSVGVELVTPEMVTDNETYPDGYILLSGE